MKKILSKMDYKGYGVINYTDRNLTFKDNLVEIGPSNILWCNRLHKGKFDITDMGDKRVVRLQYQVFSKALWVIFALVIGFALLITIKTNLSMGYNIAVFSVLLGVNFLTLHFTAKNMLKGILR
ncbi:MAG: hypothetical protein ACXVAZ_11520 [Mucilaginibacter sp.]